MKKYAEYLLALLGLGAAGCRGAVVSMYGCPTAEFKISGEVVNEKGEPVAGIGVFADYESDTTGIDGKFRIDARCTIDPPQFLSVADTDGDQNGKYESTSVEVSYTQTEKPNPDSWFAGRYEADDVRIVVKEEK